MLLRSIAFSERGCKDWNTNWGRSGDEVMQFSSMITCIDAHTAGEPIRIITSGFPSIKGATMMERRSYVLEKLDSYRKLLMREPRGHDNMYGAIITPPATDDGDIGVLFMDNGGMTTMCGHGTIGLSKVVFDTGMFKAEEGVNVLKIDAPVGRVTSYVDVCEGRVKSVAFQNVPAFTYRTDFKINLPGVGEILTDICFGGAFYVFVKAEDLGVEILPENASQLTDLGMRIRSAASDAISVLHPTSSDINWIFGTVIVTPPVVEGNTVKTRNICVFGESSVDRSPCGSGTCARMAQLHTRGILKPGMKFVNHSIIDTVFEGEIVSEVDIAGTPGIVPKVYGSAYIMGFNNIVVDSEDPMKEGFKLY